MFKPSSISFTDRSKAVLFRGSFLLFILRVFFLYYADLAVPCILVIRERADLLALLYAMFSCFFVTFPYGHSGQVRYLFVSIPDLCLYLVLMDFPINIDTIRMGLPIVHF